MRESPRHKESGHKGGTGGDKKPSASNNSKKNAQKTSAGQQKHTERKTADPPGEVPLLRRRNFIYGAVATAIGAGGLAALSFSFQRDQSAPSHSQSAAQKTVNFDSLIEKLSRRGTVALDQTVGEPKRLVVALKQFHGDSKSAKHMATDPKFSAAFVGHHNSITKMVTDAISDYGPSRVHVLIESQDMVGRRTSWSEPVVATVRQLTDVQIYELSQQEAMRSLLSGDPQSASAVVGLSQASMQIAVACYRNRRWTECIDGADPAGHFSLSKATHERIDAFLGNFRDPTDEQIKGLLDELTALDLKDKRTRHEYIQSELRRVTNEGDVTFIVIGSSHLKSGDHIQGEKGILSPLEDHVSKLANTRLVVLDETQLPGLHHYESPYAAKTLHVDFDALTVEEFRELLPALRARQ